MTKSKPVFHMFGEETAHVYGVGLPFGLDERVYWLKGGIRDTGKSEALGDCSTCRGTGFLVGKNKQKGACPVHWCRDGVLIAPQYIHLVQSGKVIGIFFEIGNGKSQARALVDVDGEHHPRSFKAEDLFSSSAGALRVAKLRTDQELEFLIKSGAKREGPRIINPEPEPWQEGDPCGHCGWKKSDGDEGRPECLHCDEEGRPFSPKLNPDWSP